MFCKYCGAELMDNTKFCYNCGKNIEENIQPQFVNPILINDNLTKRSILGTISTLLGLISLLIIIILSFSILYAIEKNEFDYEMKLGFVVFYVGVIFISLISILCSHNYVRFKTWNKDKQLGSGYGINQFGYLLSKISIIITIIIILILLFI